MWWEHQYPALADIVSFVTDDLDLGAGNGSYRVAVVRVAVDQDYARVS